MNSINKAEKEPISQRRGKIQQYLYNETFFYIILCMGSFLLTYGPMILNGYSNIYLDIGADTFCNYLPNYSFSRSLIENFTFWDTTLGLGSETSMQVANYIADPFAWIVLFFSPSQMGIGLYLSLIFKYTALCFLSYQYFKTMGLSHKPLLLSALSTNFCGWMVGWGQHYHFATFFVLFIAVLFFMEKWLREKRWIGFVLSLGIIAMKSAYFCYMTLLFLAGYYLVRSVEEIRKQNRFSLKKFILNGFLTCLLVAAALLLAALCFFPEVKTILNSPRTGKGLLPTLQLANFSEYFSFILRLFGNSILGVNAPYLGWKNFYESPFMYVGILPLFLCLIALKNKRCRMLIAFIVAACVLCIPVGVCFNAFNTITYRWTFIFVPMISLVAGHGFEMVINGKQENKWIILEYVLINSILCFYLLYLYKIDADQSNTISTSVFTVFTFSLLYFILFLLKDKKKIPVVLLFLFSLELGAVGYLTASYERGAISFSGLSDSEYFGPSNTLINQIEQNDTGFYRINKTYARIHLNDGLVQDFRGEKLYNSTLHPSYWSIRKLFDLPIDGSSYFYGFEDKQSLRDINCGKYMLSKSDASYYGYEKIGELEDGYFSYRNENVFPFGVAYQNYITESTYDLLSLAEKEAVLYDALIIPDETVSEIQGTGIDELKTYDSGTLTPIFFQTAERENCYQMQFASPTDLPVVIEMSSKENPDIGGTVYILDNTWNRTYEDGRDFSAQEGKTAQCVIWKTGVSQVEIVFDTHDSSIQFAAYSLNPEKQQISIHQKQKSSMYNLEFSDMLYTGEIVLSQDSLVYFSVLYDENWKLYANQTEIPILCVNGGFCASRLPQGKYTLELCYVPQLQYFSAICSISALVVLLTVYITEQILRRRKRNFA